MEFEEKRCQGITKAGASCPRRAMTGGKYCHLHDPSLAETRRAQASQAARAARPRRVASATLDIPCLDTLNRLPSFITGQIRAVLTGRIDPKVSNSAAYWMGLLIRVLEKTDLDERILRLEEKAGIIPGG